MLALKEGLKNPLIINNNTIFDLIIRTILNVFSSELKFPMEISEKINEEISHQFIPIINTIIRKKIGFPSGWILHLFSLCGNKETVNMLFDKCAIMLISILENAQI